MNTEKKNWKLVNFCEFDPYAVKSYCAIHNVDESLNLGDITKVDETNVEPFTMIVGGSPCQDFSVAGKQKGSVWTCKHCGNEYNPLTVHFSERDRCPHCSSENLDKSRSSLLVEWLRIIRANKPNFGIYENVKNIVGKQFKETTFKLFTDELEEYGYNVYWKVLNAKDYGIPQNRERVYLILIKKELDNGLFKYPEGFDNGIRLKDILDDNVEEKYYVSEEKLQRFITNLNTDTSVLYDPCQAKREGKSREYNDYCPTLTSRDYKDPRLVNENAVKQVGNIVNTGNWDNPQRGRIYSPDGCSPALNCCGGGGLEPKIVQVGKLNSSQDGVVVSSVGVSPTHTAGHGNMPKIVEVTVDKNIKPSVAKNYEREKDLIAQSDKEIYQCECDSAWQDNKVGIKVAPCLRASSTHTAVYSDLRIRKLTPKECFRLMGFSDKDFYAAESVVSNSQLYKQTGNSIVVDVLYYILIELYKAMPYLFDDLKLSSYFSGIGAFEIALNRLYDGINTGNFINPQSV